MSNTDFQSYILNTIPKTPQEARPSNPEERVLQAFKKVLAEKEPWEKTEDDTD